MKLNSTVVLTFVLLALMFGAGLVSAAWGIVLGREALKGITQPDTRPANNLANRQGRGARRDNFVILREDEIIANVKARINGNSRRSNTNSSTGAKSSTAAAPASTSVQFPMTAQSQGVVLELDSVRQAEKTLVLKVSLRNSGKSSVRFLYSFLSVKDDRGRELSASTDGLPAELPSSGERFTGTISIPTTILNQVEKLSLALTDYPNQQLQLQLSDIPLIQ